MKTKDTLHADQSAVLNTTHTPLPWFSFENYKGGIPLSIGSHNSQHGSVTVARVDWLPMPGAIACNSEAIRANAALIVRAVNRDHAFEALLETLKSIAAVNGQITVDSEFATLENGAQLNLGAIIAQAEPFTH